MIEIYDAVGLGATACVLFDGIDEPPIGRPRAAIMQKENSLSDTPERRSAKLVARSRALRNVARQARTHMVDQQIRK